MTDRSGGPAKGMFTRLEIATRLLANMVDVENAYVTPDDVTQALNGAEMLLAKEAERAKRDAEPDAAIEPALTCEVVVDLLGLVDRVVPIETVETWTEAQREEAADFAGALHGLASDNDVEVPPEPEWTKMYRVDYKGHYVNKPDAGGEGE